MQLFNKTYRLGWRLAFAGFCLFPFSAKATPVFWALTNVTFDVGLGPVGSPGPVVATGSFIYDADLHQFLDWNISISGASDPTVNFTFTPATSFIPSLYLNPAITQIRFVRTLPGNPPQNPFGTDPFDSNSVLIDLDFSSSPGNAGLANAGGKFTVVTAGTQLRQIATNRHYGVRTGEVTAIPEPTSLLLGGSGILLLLFFHRSPRALVNRVGSTGPSRRGST